MGLARIESDGGPAQTELTGTGTIMGTVDYMSPEQALNTKHADQRADIYSLGISLYYLLAGKAAYGGETAMEKLMAHREAADSLVARSSDHGIQATRSRLQKDGGEEDRRSLPDDERSDRGVGRPWVRRFEHRPQR